MLRSKLMGASRVALRGGFFGALRGISPTVVAMLALGCRGGASSGTGEDAGGEDSSDGAAGDTEGLGTEGTDEGTPPRVPNCVAFDDLEIVWDAATNAPSVVRAVDLQLAVPECTSSVEPMAAGTDPGTRALAVTSRLASLYGAREGNDAFEVTSTRVDAAGTTHVRMRHVHAASGAPVIGGGLTAHVDARGRVYELGGRFRGNIDGIASTPTLDAAAAEDVARGHLAAAGYVPAASVELGPVPVGATSTQLVVYARGVAPALCHEVLMASDAGRHLWKVWVDATSGEVLAQIDMVHHADERSGGPGRTVTITGNRHAQEGGGAVEFTGWDPDAFDDNRMFNPDPALSVHDIIDYGDIPVVHFPGTDWQGADPFAVSIYDNMTATLDYFHAIPGMCDPGVSCIGENFSNSGAYGLVDRNGLLGLANAQMYPFWQGPPGGQPQWNAFLIFGGGLAPFFDDLAGLDVVAHEFTHSITLQTAELIYEGESGALNESFSDIFGTVVELSTRADGNWTIGEDAMIPDGMVLRNMADPGSESAYAKGPSRYLGSRWASSDNLDYDLGGVHNNSSVQNFFFYLLVNGGTGMNDGLEYEVTGIGLENAATIALDTLIHYAQADDDYRTMRERWVSAARALEETLGECHWVEAVEAAWDAVGLPAQDDVGAWCGPWFRDADGDGFGDPSTSVVECSDAEGAGPAGYVHGGQDCDDADALVNPGAWETYRDGVVQDCSLCGPLETALVGSDIEVTWYRDCPLEWTTELGAEATWTEYDGPTLVDPVGIADTGERHALFSTLDGPQRYFRLAGVNATSCCAEQASPGCGDPQVQACVCELDNFCCDIQWDETCVAEAATCGGCLGS